MLFERWIAVGQTGCRAEHNSKSAGLSRYAVPYNRLKARCCPVEDGGAERLK
jgi:hypothetical protein